MRSHFEVTISPYWSPIFSPNKLGIYSTKNVEKICSQNMWSKKTPFPEKIEFKPSSRSVFDFQHMCSHMCTKNFFKLFKLLSQTLFFMFFLVISKLFLASEGTRSYSKKTFGLSIAWKVHLMHISTKEFFYPFETPGIYSTFLVLSNGTKISSGR